MLTRREQEILRCIISEYVTTAAPVSSGTIARKYGLNVSPATIRHEMAHLEEEGYIAQPHHSAGRIPLEKGYRHYVEALMSEGELPQDERFRIRHQFHQVRTELEQWLALAAAILARLVQNMAITTWPKAAEPRLKRLELVSLNQFMALLVLVLTEARIRQRMIAFDEALSQEGLNAMAARLNSECSGHTGPEIAALNLARSPAEERVVATLVQIMESEQEQEQQQPYVAGLPYLLAQPEFTAADKASEMAQVLEGRGLLRSVLPLSHLEEECRVIIGTENKEEIMRDCTVILSCYGHPGEFSGIIAVVGPVRMRYEHNISAVRFLSQTMSELVGNLYS